MGSRRIVTGKADRRQPRIPAIIAVNKCVLAPVFSIGLAPGDYGAEYGHVKIEMGASRIAFLLAFSS
jgi:hypothetical protein